MKRTKTTGALWAALAVAGALVLAACGSASGSGSGQSAKAGASTTIPSGGVATAGSSGQKIKGGTVTMAEAPGSPPTYIFPMQPAAQETEANIDVSWLLYRPLYWYGNNQNPGIDYNDSIGKPPVFSDGGKRVTITLKDWKWSNGEQVTSRDVEFWMNLLEATKDSGSWGFYTKGYFPDMVVKQQYPNPSTVVFTLNRAYNEKWFLYSELSQITPIPIAWDRTSIKQPAPKPTAAHLPDTTPAGAKAVYKMLNGASGNLSSWAASPIWSIVDGPWKLASANFNGQVVFHPNLDYSGSPKATIHTFIEKPFTSNAAEFNSVRAGGPKSIQFGYLPPEDTPTASKVEAAGYRNLPEYDFSYSFILINFNNPTIGPVFRQLYVRQALQHAVDQNGWIKAFLYGNAVPSYGPEPIVPKNSYADAYERSDLYPYDLKAAKQLLTSHGWTERNGVDVCTRPGSGPTDCGAGVKPGQQLSFSLGFASGIGSLATEMQDFSASLKQIGIKIALTEHPLNTVFGLAAPCQPSQKACSWQALDYGSGVQYAVGYYPSGEQLLETGAGFNLDNYSNPTMDRLIKATTTAPATKAQSTLDAYQNFAAKDLPDIFTPTSAGNPYAGDNTLVSKHLGGVTFNVFTLITPETWYLTK